MSITLLDTLVAALERVYTNNYNQFDQVAPVAILWPDKERQWEGLVSHLRARITLLTLGSYDAAQLTGPAIWLRCMLAGTLLQKLPAGTLRVIYLPELSRQELEHNPDCPSTLLPLLELQYRSIYWTRPNGHDWQLADFLEDGSEGCGVEVRRGEDTAKALQRALPKLALTTLERLREDAPWRASDFDALAGFRAGSAELGIEEIIAMGESDTLEFKSTFGWDVQNSKANKLMENIIVKTVASFLNSPTGGTLLIGVADDGTVLGLQNDYSLVPPTANNPNQTARDRFEQKLVITLLNKFGRQFAHQFRVTFHSVGGEEVCKVSVVQGSAPVVVKDDNKEKFYVRTGNATNELEMSVMAKYILQHWK